MRLSRAVTVESVTKHWRNMFTVVAMLLLITCCPCTKSSDDKNGAGLTGDSGHIRFSAAGGGGGGGGVTGIGSAAAPVVTTFNEMQLRYDTPDDCKYKIAYGEDVHLDCNLRTVNSDFDTTNFSVIPPEHTVALSVICNDEILAKSSLEPKGFAHLMRLRELNLEYCKLARFSADALAGLTDLRNLTIRTHNIRWSGLNLEIESDSFAHTVSLERLDLSQNNIWSLPENLFCSLHGLVYLNISENRLQDVNELGFRERQLTGLKDDAANRNPDVILPTASQKLSCLLDLEILEAAFNHFVLMPANGFGTLKRLKFLKINDNEISMVADRALGGLKNLEVLDLSSNKIVALPSELFKDPAPSIQQVYLQNNSISVLSPGLFSNLEQLQLLDLSLNQLSSAWIDRSTFAGLIRLVLLNLSSNKITKLEPEMFSDLYTVQIMNLRHNYLENIAADTFSPMNNLHTLLLSYNKIKYLDAYSLNGLYVLSSLSLDNNKLSGVHPEAFRNCSSLQDLSLNANELRTVPLAIKDMRLLRTVDLGENSINTLEDYGFRGMHNLYGLRLIQNKIENITKNAFNDLPSLQILNLARNKIAHIDIGTFEVNPTIQAMRLDENALIHIEGLFTKMPNLMWLNISENQIEQFDYADIPLGLQWLDLHKNYISNLSNKYALDNQLHLQTLDASFNRLQTISASAVPNCMELLFLNDNLITYVEPHTFLHKTNLTRVDLYANQMTDIDVKALLLTPVSDTKRLPEFYIGGNPFICDCNIEWLQKINSLMSRHFPYIMDLEAVYCKLLHSRDRAYIPLLEAEPQHFLCPYRSHCFELCQCCELPDCGCHMTCPTNCTCFHDQSWSTNVVDCAAAAYNELPTRVPIGITELYIDGNSFAELSSLSFHRQNNLKILFANNSNIQSIGNDTFTTLRRLVVLHLETNRLYHFTGGELNGLDNLRELYLHNNRIAYINNRTFIGLKKLEVLRLDGNKLSHFEAWQLTLNPYLVEIGLADNAWSCECNYLNKLRTYLQTNGGKIADAARISCVYNNATSIVKEKNGAKCTLKDGLTSMVQSREIEDLLPLLLVATCAFVGFFALIVGVFCYRHELKMWTMAHCWPTMCYRTSNFVNDLDKDRLYDAYITYSLQDEQFVNQVLVNTLEREVGYRICMHYRDFNVNTYVADTIIEAVESSKRAVLVLSKNFLYNEWTRFEIKSAVHEVLKRRRKLIFILYGDLPQRDIDADMRLYLRTNTCIEWDDKKFWQKLRIALPHIKKSGGNNCLAKRSAVNIYATAHDYPTAVGGIGGGGGSGGGGGGGIMSGGTIGRMPHDCGTNNYATINACGRNYDNYDTVSCKFSTAANDRRSGGNDQRLQHEYAVPTNCILPPLPSAAVSMGKYSSSSCERIGEHFECTQAISGKYHTAVRPSQGLVTATPALPSQSAGTGTIIGLSGSNGGGGGTPTSSSSSSSSTATAAAATAAASAAAAASALPNNSYPFNNRNSNCHSSNCAGDGCNSKSDINNCTLAGDPNCIDRRLPQAMWA